MAIVRAVAREAGETLRDAPLLMRAGLAVLALGAILDFVFHLAPAAWLPTIEGLLGEDGRTAHFVTLVGMAVTLIGVVTGRRTGGSREGERSSSRRWGMR